MRSYFVGLDVHSRSSTYCVQDEQGGIAGRGEVPTSLEGLKRMKQECNLPDGTQVGLETGTVAFFAARQLQELGLHPLVIDAHEVRLKAYRPMHKSDRRDAEEICEGVRRGICRSIVHVPPPEIRHLRETLSRRRHFVRTQTSEVNAVKRLLRAEGLGHLAKSLGTPAAWDKLEASLPSVPDFLANFVSQHRMVWEWTGCQVRVLDQELRCQAQHFATARELLESVPGVGMIVALTAVAVFSDVTRFPSAKHAASYAGLTPSTLQSGDRDPRHGHITRRGSTELRSMLCQAAHHARRPAHPLNPYFSQIVAKHGHKHAVVAVAHRLCRILYAMLRDGQPFRVEKLPIERGPFERKSTRMYRLKRKTSAAA